MANNTLSQLPDTIFDSMQVLTRLDLSGNFFTTMTSRLVSRLTSLVSLDLSHNEIESIHGQAFSGLKSLKFLQLDGNRIAKLPRNLFRNTKVRIIFFLDYIFFSSYRVITKELPPLLTN